MSITSLIKRLVAVVILACAAQSPGGNAALLSLQPATTIAGSGESVSLDLMVSGLGDFSPSSLGAFDISIGYDPMALIFSSYSLGGLLGLPTLFEALDVGTGDSGALVNLAEVSLLSMTALNALQTAEFTLATLNFNVFDLGVGDTTLLFIQPNALLGDPAGSPLAATELRPALLQGRASVSLPGTLSLCIACLFVLSRSRQFRAANTIPSLSVVRAKSKLGER